MVFLIFHEIMKYSAPFLIFKIPGVGSNLMSTWIDNKLASLTYLDVKEIPEIFHVPHSHGVCSLVT